NSVDDTKSENLFQIQEKEPSNNLLGVLQSKEEKAAKFRQDLRIMLYLVTLFIPTIFFWTIYEQQDSSWVLQGGNMYKKLWNYEIDPLQIQTSNCALIILMVPITSMIKLSTLMSILLGLCLAACSFFTSAILETVRTKTTHILWQIPQYIFITLGEVFLSMNGLEFASELAPEKFKCFVVAIWLMMVSFGSLIVAFISGLKIFESQVVEYIFYALTAIAASILFIFIFKNFEKKRTSGKL
ncbi:Peptide transporter, partial [Pseudoloma neurophilia]